MSILIKPEMLHSSDWIDINHRLPEKARDIALITHSYAIGGAFLDAQDVLIERKTYKIVTLFHMEGNKTTLHAGICWKYLRHQL